MGLIPGIVIEFVAQTGLRPCSGPFAIGSIVRSNR
jgi:hypothetical protein